MEATMVFNEMNENIFFFWNGEEMGEIESDVNGDL